MSPRAVGAVSRTAIARGSGSPSFGRICVAPSMVGTYVRVGAE